MQVSINWFFKNYDHDQVFKIENHSTFSANSGMSVGIPKNSGTMNTLTDLKAL